MGRTAKKLGRRTKKNLQYKKSHKTARNGKYIDEIQDELRKEKELGKKLEFKIDEDLPGLGQHYCTPCARHFTDEQTLLQHNKSRGHKRRCKDVEEEQYTHDEANWAAGRGKQVYKSATEIRENVATPMAE
tara:strand:- start:102 stop:494 length:393 start_codon:yes stop_codon:yes gene_type:complete